MIIDTHVHFVRPIDSQGNKQTYTPYPSSAEDYLALMDDAGIDRAFFISWSPEDIPSDLIGKNIPVESVRETLSRDYALEVMRTYGDSFYWFPCHLGPAVENHMALARENLELGAAGLKLVTSFWGELPDDPRLLPMYDLARDYQAQIILDTSYWYLGKNDHIDPDKLPQGHREVAKRVKDFPDYANHMRRIFEAYPTVNFQLAHAGARDWNWTVESAAEVGLLMRDYPHVYADLGALSTEATALEALVETAGADRVMFGTDYPHFAQGPAMTALLDAVRRPGRFSEEVVRMLLGENALRFVRARKPGLESKK